MRREHVGVPIYQARHPAIERWCPGIYQWKRVLLVERPMTYIERHTPLYQCPRCDQVFHQMEMHDCDARMKGL